MTRFKTCHPREKAPLRGALNASFCDNFAYTLPEMLIAIGLIAVLGLLIMAGAGRVGEQSKSARCLSNMRQVGEILLRYSSENNGHLVPTVELLPPLYQTGSTWLVLMDRAGYLPKESYHERQNTIMACPSRQSPPTYSKPHYGINRNMGFDNLIKKGEPYRKMVRVERPSQTLVLGESEGIYMIQSHSAVFLEYDDKAKRKIAFPHNQTSHLIFLDGHAEAGRGPWKIPKKGDSYPFY